MSAYTASSRKFKFLSHQVQVYQNDSISFPLEVTPHLVLRESSSNLRVGLFTQQTATHCG